MIKRIRNLVCIAIGCISTIMVCEQKAYAAPNGDYVVILHGIFRSSSHMSSLAKYLTQQGYDVINMDYPSTDAPLAELTLQIKTQVESRLTEDKPVHFVGYSMGGLLVRALLNQYRPKQLGRVVLLAPPNQGSEVADFLKNNYLYQKFYGPAGQELITDQSKFQHLFGHIDYELGVIAGNKSLDPFSSFLIKGPDDGKVSVESTKVVGMKDHIVVQASHTLFPYNQKVQKQTSVFLKHGAFQAQTLDK